MPHIDSTAFSLSHQVMENLKLEPGLEREISRMCLRSLNSVNLDLPDNSSPNSQRIQEFFLLMAICNTVVVTHHAHEDLVSDLHTVSRAWDPKWPNCHLSLSFSSWLYMYLIDMSEFIFIFILYGL